MRITPNEEGTKFRGGSFDGLNGTIISIDQAQAMATVGLNSTPPETFSVPVEYLSPAYPEKRDNVVVTGGELVGRVGMLWTTDGETLEGIVNFKNDDQLKDTPSRVVKLVYLAKYNQN